MARIDIRSNGATLSDGVLQLENGVAMDTTLRNVADQNNTTSPLKLSTTAVQVTSPLRITTSDASGFYLDAEDSATNNRFSIKRDPSAQEVTLDFASNPAGSTTTVGAIRTYGDGVNLSNAVTFREDGQVTFSERVNVEADSLVTTETCSVIAASTTNANLVIAPNGTGALIASIPDGTATGGNARGDDAVDLQIIRGAATNVASGNYSVISGGQSNTASSNFSTVSGGQSNTASTDSHATIVGGISNVSSGPYSTAGGSSNSISGRGAIGIGETNVVSGRASSAFGSTLNITGSYSGSFGNNNLVSSVYSMGLGNGTKSYLLGQLTNSGNFNINRGNNQYSFINAGGILSLTTGGTAVLSLDGTGVTNLIIPDGSTRAWNVQVNWVGLVSAISGTATGISIGDVITSVDLLAFKKVAGVSSASSHTSTATKTMVTTPASYAACSINYTAGASQEMALTFTGPIFAGGGTITMRVNAKIELTEIASN